MTEIETRPRARLEELRIKIKSLAAEARIIRAREKKLTGLDREKLHNHRVCEVRHEARNSLLAYAFIRGRSYASQERSARTVPSPEYVSGLVERFGGDRSDHTDRVKLWLCGHVAM